MERVDGTIVLVALPGMALALLLLGGPWKAPQERLETIPVPIQNDEEQGVRRVMVPFKLGADQAATNEQVGRCDHPGTERNQR